MSDTELLSAKIMNNALKLSYNPNKLSDKDR